MICSKAWGVGAKDILSLWNDKGNDAARFGTSIHNILEKIFNKESYDYSEVQQAIDLALENFKKYEQVGDIIKQSKKGQKVNYALPSHPDLVKLMFGDVNIDEYMEQLISEFHEMHEANGFDYNSVQEPLVTYTPYNMGGFTDKLQVIDWDKKIARVQDYKIQIDADTIDKKRNKYTNEFKGWPANKLTGHTIQLNYYRFCLWKAGWTIVGLDLFVREDSWKYYELELLDMEWFEELIIKYNLKNI